LGDLLRVASCVKLHDQAITRYWVRAMLELDGDVPFQHAQASQLTKQLDEAEPSLNTAELLREIIRFRGLAAEWAHLAAPYVHPRLAAVAHRHTIGQGQTRILPNGRTSASTDCGHSSGVGFGSVVPRVDCNPFSRGTFAA
jgi:hypothetical protein